MPRLTTKSKKWGKCILFLLFIAFIIVGPWPADNTHWSKAKYGIDTLDNLAQTEELRGKGELMIGFSSKSISPEIGQPLMGYTDRETLASNGVLTECNAKALTVVSGEAKVTFISVDALLVLDLLRKEVLYKTAIPPDELYFMASHTHSGPGGWAKGVVEELYYGGFNQKYFDRMLNQICAAITESREDKNLKPATLEYVTANAPELLENRIYGDERAAYPLLTAAVFRSKNDDNKILSILTTFSAHATVVRKRTLKSSADYPGELCRKLQVETGAEMVLFGAAAMGDARPNANGEEAAVRMGETLAKKLIPKIKAGKGKKVESITALNLPVELPPARLAVAGSGLKLFPLFMPSLMSTRTHISLVRIGDIAYVGWPADVAGELMPGILEHTKENHLQDIILTSFNGNWRGYFTTSQTYFERNAYATRTMGFMGPWAGDYFTDLTAQMLKRCAPLAGEPPAAFPAKSN